MSELWLFLSGWSPLFQAEMKNLKDPVFLFFCFLFCSNKILEMNGFFIPFIHAYMDDLICLPVILNITLFLFRKFIYRDDQYCFPLFFILSALLMFSLAFEALLPLSSAAYTADPWDILAYSLGGIFFHFWFNTGTPVRIIS
jgi:hypothetical protein